MIILHPYFGYLCLKIGYPQIKSTCLSSCSLRPTYTNFHFMVFVIYIFHYVPLCMYIYIYVHIKIPLYSIIFHYIPLYSIILLYYYIPLYSIIFHYIPLLCTHPNSFNSVHHILSHIGVLALHLTLEASWVLALHCLERARPFKHSPGLKIQIIHRALISVKWAFILRDFHIIS